MPLTLNQPDSLYQPGVPPKSNTEPPHLTQDTSVQYDSRQAQKPLVARSEELTQDDFAAADGNRQRFVELLAKRGGVSLGEAADNLSAFECRRKIVWRS